LRSTHPEEVPLSPAPAQPIELIGAFESTYLPAHDVDVLETSQHTLRWREDLGRLRDCGVRRLRYPVRWHRVEGDEGRLDWRATDEVLGHLREEGFEPIVDVLHHTSYPRWLSGGLADPRFGPAYLRFCEAFARRYGWIREYTLFNEPFATLFLAGHEGVWPPYGRGVRDLVALYRNVAPALAEASRRFRDLLPGARHVWVDTCEGHSALDPAGEAYAAMADDRRFFALDLVLGRLGDGTRPFVREVVAAGGEDLLALEPGHVDVLGLDYYAHSEWCFRGRRGPAPPGTTHSARHGLLHGDPAGRAVEGITPSPQPRGLAALALEYWDRYGLPMLLTETNIRGATSDRATWLKHTLEQVELARWAGADISGFCWFPFVDSLDWNTLLARADGCIDPVGVLWLDEDLDRHESSMSAAYRLVAGGAPSAALLAYELTPEVADWVRGLRGLMAHFDWRPAPADELALARRGVLRARPTVGRAA
jgi:beta-glucosidase/6-phospho-beta-glucosidase/beta-galactosidase